MDSTKLISALDSNLRREILSILTERAITVSEAQNALRNKGFDIKYRETVYRALETLVESELVEKYYASEKGLLYRLRHWKYTIRISKTSVEVIPES